MCYVRFNLCRVPRFLLLLLLFVQPSKRYADVIIPRGGHNEVAIDLIVSKMRDILTRAGEESHA